MVTTDSSNAPGFNADGNKEGTFLEGRESSVHTHNDGSRGTDVEAYRVTYNEGKAVRSEKATDYGKIHKTESSGK